MAQQGARNNKPVRFAALADGSRTSSEVAHGILKVL